MPCEVSTIAIPILWMRKQRQGCEVTCSTQLAKQVEKQRGTWIRPTLKAMLGTTTLLCFSIADEVAGCYYIL